MLVKIKALHEKAFYIGLSLILLSPLFLFLSSCLFPVSDWMTMIIQAVIWGFALLFVLSAADSRHSRIKKKK